MRLVGLPKAFYYFSKHRPVALSAAADQKMQKLKVWEVLKKKGVGDQEAAQLLRVSRATLYRWRSRLRQKGLKGLEEKSRRPHRIRRPGWSSELVEAVLALREEYPSWGKDKLYVLLGRVDWKTSSATVGRILVDLKRRGVLHEPPRGLVKYKKGVKAGNMPFASRGTTRSNNPGTWSRWIHWMYILWIQGQ